MQPLRRPLTTPRPAHSTRPSVHRQPPYRALDKLAWVKSCLKEGG